MRLVIHMLRMFLPSPASPFGATLLTVRLILQGARPLTPGQRGASLLAVQDTPPRRRPGEKETRCHLKRMGLNRWTPLSMYG